MPSPYRPHDSGHDYYGVGTYLITLVVSGRNPLLGRLVGDAVRPEVQLSEIGEMVRDAWLSIPAKAAEHGNQVRVLASVCMPDHFHGVIEVLAPMQWCLGDIMQAFKAACTSRWQERRGMKPSCIRPISDECFGPAAPAWLREMASCWHTEAELIRAMSKKRREEYFSLVGRQSRPLFDANYDDTICLDARHQAAMIAYVHDNPRRALLRRQLPNVMQRSLRVQIGERCYGTFGNLFLLRWARKIQVFCHRRHPVRRFHNLNHLAAEICSFQGEARIIGN